MTPKVTAFANFAIPAQRWTACHHGPEALASLPGLLFFLAPVFGNAAALAGWKHRDSDSSHWSLL